MCQKQKLFMFGVHYLNLIREIVHNNVIIYMRRRAQARARKYKRLTLLISSFYLSKTLKARCKYRNLDWWEDIVLQKFKDDEYVENFRVTKNTFQYLCKSLSQELEPKVNVLNNHWRRRKIVSVEKKIAITLYFLGSCCDYQVVGNQFGVQKSTVCSAIHEVVSAILKVLTPQYIRMPNEAEANEIDRCFISNVIGAIDGSHIPIIPPSDGHSDYINQKGWPSLLLQAIVDHSYKFMDICIKNPATHGGVVLTTSNLYQTPLLPWLMNGFSVTGLTPIEDSFNSNLNSARVANEIAFGRLKSRWRCLLKRLDIHYSFVPQVVAACCTLHNLVETRKEPFHEVWLVHVEDAETLFPQPNKNMKKIFLTTF